MTIQKTTEGSAMTVALAGRLDTVTAPELEAALADSLAGINQLVFDLSGLDYISSAGLRVLLATHKAVGSGGGEMIVRGANELVMEVFEVTGFTDILNLQ